MFILTLSIENGYHARARSSEISEFRSLHKPHPAEAQATMRKRRIRIAPAATREADARPRTWTAAKSSFAFSLRGADWCD